MKGAIQFRIQNRLRLRLMSRIPVSSIMNPSSHHPMTRQRRRVELCNSSHCHDSNFHLS